MKLALTPRALLLATAAAATFCLSRADILVQDGFLDETTVADVAQQLPGAPRFRDVVDLPSALYGRLLSVLQPGAEGRNLQAPVRGEQGHVAAHKDHFADGSMAAAQVGLVYLEGDGRMTFTHDATAGTRWWMSSPADSCPGTTPSTRTCWRRGWPRAVCWGRWPSKTACFSRLDNL